MAPNEIFDIAKLYAETFFREGARELIEMSETGILKDGVVRHCHHLLSGLHLTDTLGVAISLIEDACVRHAAKELE